MAYLADTNVLSELTKRQPHRAVEAWLLGIGRLYVSAISVEELAFGFAWHPHPRSQAGIEKFLADCADVLPVTSAIAMRAGQMRGTFRASGISRHPADTIIAATASVHGLTVATRNLRDFGGTGVRLLNPFTA